MDERHKVSEESTHGRLYPVARENFDKVYSIID